MRRSYDSCNSEVVVGVGGMGCVCIRMHIMPCSGRTAGR